MLYQMFGGNHWMSFALAPFGLFGMYIAGKRLAWGWMFSIFTQVLWVTYALAITQYGMIIGSMGYLTVYIKNYRKWRNQPEIILSSDESRALRNELSRLSENDADMSTASHEILNRLIATYGAPDWMR